MIRELKIGIDIDGTVTCPKTFIPYLNQAFNTNLNYEDIKDYNLAKAVNITDDEFGKWLWENEGEIYRVSPLAQNVRETLMNWITQYQLLYISARHKRYEQITFEWFSEHDLPYDGILCTGDHNKIRPIHLNQIDLFLEDNYHNACQIAKECQIPVLLFNTPYNQGPLPDNVIRIQNWYEAEEWVTNWKTIQKTP